MEMNRDALLRIVKAARQSMKIAKVFGSLLIDNKGWTLPDEMTGNLKDALFTLAGETLGPGEQFKDSMTERLLTSDMSDEGVTDFFLMKSRADSRIRQAEQPKPNIIDRQGFNVFYDLNGGYILQGDDDERY